MVKDIISIGDRVDLHKIQSSSGRKIEPPVLYASKVIDEPEFDMIRLAMPFENGRVVPLEVGERHIIWFYTEKGIYQCTGEIVKRYREGSIFAMVLKIVSSIEKNQRREYYRLECMLDIRFRYVSEEELRLEKKIQTKHYVSQEEREYDERDLKELKSLMDEATVTDISGGGIRFNASYQFEKGSTIEVALNLPLEHQTVNLTVRAKVVTSEAITGKPGLYDNRVRYVDISEIEREMIIRYIFWQERKNLSREKGM